MNIEKNAFNGPSGSRFYFLRHGETEHNLRKLYSDDPNVPLNRQGRRQARALRDLLEPLAIATVCSSPLLRAQQTKEIALADLAFEEVVVEELKECPAALWRLFLASESRLLSRPEQQRILAFFKLAEGALRKILSCRPPLLVVAHGGTYWAFSHLLKLEGARKIGNCSLVELFCDEKNRWQTKLLSSKPADRKKRPFEIETPGR